MLLAAAIAAGCGTAPAEVDRGADPPVEAAQAELAEPAESPTADAAAPPAPATGAEAPADPPEPTTVVVPRIGVSHPLVPVGLHPDRTLVVPDDASVAGWYTGAPRPGQTGPSVVVGHNSWGGQAGVFHRLHELVAGDVIEVHHDDGSVVRFAVDRVEQHPKDRFPSESVYGDTAGEEIRVITCGGVFDRARGAHVDNVIVYGARVS